MANHSDPPPIERDVSKRSVSLRPPSRTSNVSQSSKSRKSSRGENRASAPPRKLQAGGTEDWYAEEEDQPLHVVYFQRAIQTAILLNSAQMGLEFSLTTGTWQTLWLVCDHVFTAFFLMEAVIKLYQYKCEYFLDKKERWWNMVDLFLVIVTVVDNWLLNALNVDGSELQAMKVLRLVRLSRVLRLLKEQKDLMMVVIGIVGSLKSMFWVGVLLIVVVYATAIACCTLIGRSEAYSTEDPEINFSGPSGDPDLIRAMFTLLNLSLGQGHMETFNPLFANQVVLIPFMFIYVMLVTVGILNSIIGIICEKTAEAGRANLEEEMRAFRNVQREMVNKLKTLITEMNEDGDSVISQDELDAAATDPIFIEMLKEINLPASFSVVDMHLMLDKDGDGELTEEEFEEGMYDLVYSDDFQRQCILLRSLACAKRNMHNFRQEVKDEFRVVRELIRGDIKRKSSAHDAGGVCSVETKAIAPPPPGGAPPIIGNPCVGVWSFMDQEKSIPSPAGWKFEGETPQDLAMKQVRTNTLKAVAVGAWELLEQDGAVQKALAESGNLAAMKQVRARAMKAQAERQASRPASRDGQGGELRVLGGGGPLLDGVEFSQPPIVSVAAPLGGRFCEEGLSSDALPGQMPCAYPSSPNAPSKPLAPAGREEV